MERPQRRRLTRFGGILLLLCAFMLVFLVLFLQFRTAALQSISSANESFGHYADTVLTLSNVNIRTSAMQVFYTSSIQTLRTSVNISESERILGHRDLGNFVSNGSFIDRILIYNQNLDTVFTSESGYSSDRSDRFHDPASVALLCSPPRNDYLAPIRRRASENGAVCYSFLFSAQSPSGFSSMLLDVNAEWYETHLLGSLSEERHVIVDASGAPVIPEAPALELPPVAHLQEAFRAEPESGYVLSDQRLFPTSCWVYRRLGNTGWYYLEAFQLERDVPGLVGLQRTVAVIFVLIGTAMLLLFLYLIFSVFPAFHHISGALSELDPKKENYIKRFDELVAGHHDYQSAKTLRDLQAGIIPDQIAIPIVFLTCAEGGGEAVYAALTRAGDVKGVTLTRSEKRDVLIVPDCAARKRSRILAQLRETAAVPALLASLPCYAESQILSAFEALEELRALAFLYPERPVLGQELLAACNEPSGLQRELVHQIEGNLKKGQMEEAWEQWLSLFESIRRDRLNDFRFALRYVDRMLSDLSDAEGTERSVEAHLTEISDLQRYMEGRFKAITDAVGLRQQKEAEELTEMVWNVIRKRYREENCCAQLIAKELEISPATLNRQFRATAGMSVGDAVQSVHLDRACELLREADLTVEQVARQVGCGNTKYFFVLFKKRFGQTPAQFRIGLSDKSD